MRKDEFVCLRTDSRKGSHISVHRIEAIGGGVHEAQLIKVRAPAEHADNHVLEALSDAEKEVVLYTPAFYSQTHIAPSR